jgi:hypothetical protein
MRFAELLGDVMARLKLPGEPPTSEARNLDISLKTGQTISLSLLEDDATVSISALLCFYPEMSRQRRFFELLLGAHTFGYATQGCTFAVDAEASKIFMFRIFPLTNIDVEGFTRAMRIFIETHRGWLEAYQSGKLLDLVDPEPAAS